MVNWALMFVTLGLTLYFEKSDNLAAAYGIAVSLTMLATTGLLYFAMRELWQWGRLPCMLICGTFFVIDASFSLANSMKILEGGWVPLALAWTIWTVMLVWHKGVLAVGAQIESQAMPIAAFMADVKAQGVPRVPGTAVFLTRASIETPPVLRWHVKHNRALHEHLVALTIKTEAVPYIDPENRMKADELVPNFWRIIASYGFMERPNVPELLNKALNEHGCTVNLADVTYYIGHETIGHAAQGGLPTWQEEFFAFMLRNSAHMTRFFSIPVQNVVEIGRQVEI
jgi:KUP system potassium uptake protein